MKLKLKLKFKYFWVSCKILGQTLLRFCTKNPLGFSFDKIWSFLLLEIGL